MQAYLPKRHISTYMFSATFPPQVIRLAEQFLRQPGFLNLSSDHIHVTETEHVYYTVPGMDKDRSLVRIIEVENPPSALIFCNTKVRVDYVTVVLQRFGYDADELTSDLSQAAREKVLERVRKGTLRFLVATDVAARGIDLPELSHVIQYEPPEDPEAYIHRAGRTGRAGGSGTAISLVNADGARRPAAHRQALYHRPAGAPAAQRRRCGADRLRAHHRPAGGAPAQPRPLAGRTHAALPAAGAQPGRERDETGLLAMLLDDFYQETFHAPLVPPAAEGAAPASRRTTGRSARAPGRGAPP